MKEMYFDRKTITLRGLDFLNRIAGLRDRSPFGIEIKKSALLVLDMQNYFLHPESHAFIPSAPAIVSYLSDLIEFFIKKKSPVIFTRHLNNDENSGQMKSWWSDLITRKNSFSSLHKDFIQIKAPVIIKTQYDAFFDTNLETLLRERGVEQLIIGGVMTHLCCETTARSGFVRGFEIFFGIDFTATYNVDFHLSSLINISHGFGVPLLFKEVMEELSGYIGK